jgi:hypothetical protein
MRLVVTLGVFLVGCGSSYVEIAPVLRFPTPEVLDDLDVPAVAARESLPRTTVEHLEVVDAPAFGEGTAAIDDDAVSALLTEQETRLRPTTGMRCAAHNLADFYLRERALPDDAAMEHVLGRCGVTSIEPVVAVHVAESGDEDGFAAVADALRPALRRITPFAAEIGSAVVSDDDARVWLGIASPHRVALSTTRLEDGRFLIAGRLETERLRAVSAWVNQGDYGVARCERAPEVHLPEMRFICEMNRHDPAARVDLVAVPRQRLASRRLASMLLWADAESSRPYGAQPALPVAEDDAAAPTARLGALLAAAREEAGRDPIPIVPAESSRQAPLLPKLILARAAGDATTAETLELGFLAGWSVEEPIASATIHVLESSSSDPSSAFTHHLATPNARRALLAADADTVAIAARETASGLVATFTLYRAFDRSRLDAIQSAFHAHLDDARRQSGVRPFTYLDDVTDLQQEADEVTDEGVHPREALDDAMARLRGRLGRTVRCYHQEGYDPSWTELPVQFQESGDVSAVTGIGFHRPAGAAWGQYVFFLCVFPE